LRQGVARNPAAAELHESLGLALVRRKQMAEAMAELLQATKLAPDDARFAYVYAVGLQGAGQPAKSLAALELANRKHPYDRDILEALATYAANDRKREAALDYATKLRDLDPENPRYAQMLRELSTRGP